MEAKKRKSLVIIGGGFAGIRAAIELGNSEIDVTIVDKRNFHLFQPLLYQVAAGFLAPGDIATPIRAIVARYENITVIHEEVQRIDCNNQKVVLGSEGLSYDYLVIACGVTHSYFGNDSWASFAPGLKTVEDATKIRAKVLLAYERAEKSTSQKEKERLLTFCIVGAGPTGVELAGTLAELAQSTLTGEFRNIKPQDTRIILIEAGSGILNSFDESLSEYSKQTLADLGVNVRTGARVTHVSASEVVLESEAGKESIQTENIIWAAGVRAPALSQALAESLNLTLERDGKIPVNSFLQIESSKSIFVAGDIAACRDKNAQPLPGVAPVAIQQGAYVGQAIQHLERGYALKPFRYFNKGNMAVIGRGRAIVESFGIKLRGFLAWLVWAFVHILFLIEFENKLVVFIRWAWNYITNRRGSRLITEREPADS